MIVFIYGGDDDRLGGLELMVPFPRLRAQAATAITTQSLTHGRHCDTSVTGVTMHIQWPMTRRASKLRFGCTGILYRFHEHEEEATEAAPTSGGR